MRAHEFITEKWTKKYKNSINCSSPRGFSQKAHCAGRKKNEDVAEDAQLPGDFKLMGQNLFLKNLARNLKQRYPDATVKLSSDRVTAYHNEGDDEALTVMGTEVMDSGYIGVGLDDAFTESFQGVLVPTIKQTTEQLLAANPGTKPALFLSTDNWNPDAWTHIATKLGYRLVADDESLDEQGVVEGLDEDLRKWFKDKWVRFGPDGKIRGDCARGSEKEGKPKCLPQSKAHALGKKGRATAASRKRREDPNANRSGKAINVKTK